MNLIYRSIWNDKTGTFVAVSENAQSAGKIAGSCRNALTHPAGFALKALAVSLMLSFGGASYALPAGGAVAAGAAVIANTAITTTITQSTQNAAINWQSFGIAAGQTVQFLQPNSSSVALNRVLGPNPSAIYGNLSANGQVFLINPNGVLFGSGASVNVGGLVASTLNITDANFMAGKYIFSNTGSGTVVNQGAINADGGYVALLGTNVSNQGTISARLGTVALAAGSGVTLDLVGDKLLNVKVDQGAVKALVENGGLIQADGGGVLMTAQGAGNLLSTVVNNTGVIRAQTLSNINGTIKLLADMDSGTVKVGGTLDASGWGAGQTGGNVTATAHHVGLFGGRIDASGDAGGGTVLVGGGYQGNNRSVQNASATYMSADATVNADAITRGDGGTVIVWSNDSTRAYGSITARGGALAGNGGLIETSGHWLDVTGIKINASAMNGKSGTWLLDPADVTISTAVTSNDTLTAGVFSPDPGQGSANINSSALEALLIGGTNVTITTTNTGASGTPISGRGDINVNAPLTYGTGGVNTTLTLNAIGGDVNINSAISTTQGNLVVCCGRDVNVNAAITLVRGSMLLSAGRDVNQNATITSTDGNIAMCAAHDINVFAPLSSTRGTVDAANNRSLANLGVRQGLSFIAGTGASGPGLAGGGGAVNISPPGGTVTVVQSAVVGEQVPVTVIYNPILYSAPVVDYSTKFSTFNPLTVQRLVFPGGADKVFDGTTAATFTSVRADSLGTAPTGVTLAGTGTFDTAAVGVGKLVTYSGLVLAGGNAASFALPADCCGPTIGTGRTTASIFAAIPPVVVAPPVVVVPPVVVAPPVVVVPPVVVAPPVVVVPPPVIAALPILAGASYVVPPYLPPTVFTPSTQLPLVVASNELPPSMVLVEKPSEMLPKVAIALPAKEVPPTYVAPVRPRKQGRQ